MPNMFNRLKEIKEKASTTLNQLGVPLPITPTMLQTPTSRARMFQRKEQSEGSWSPYTGRYLVAVESLVVVGVFQDV
ncbi:hypothetical protein [Alicyclobacillus fodiniaquatilis]|uniref:Uncharacterized protein n=1 Tax=Alicyclobacillus fodiniaquatilis TaxID=1661150 RepID=A0ABW4JNU2_9BACL